MILRHQHPRARVHLHPILSFSIRVAPGVGYNLRQPVNDSFIGFRAMADSRAIGDADPLVLEDDEIVLALLMDYSQSVTSRGGIFRA